MSGKTTRQFRIADFSIGDGEFTKNTCSAHVGTVRFIDPENGDDNNDGLTPDTPWKTEREWQEHVPDCISFGPTTNRFRYKLPGRGDTWEPFDCGLGEHGG